MIKPSLLAIAILTAPALAVAEVPSCREVTRAADDLEPFDKLVDSELSALARKRLQKQAHNLGDFGSLVTEDDDAAPSAREIGQRLAGAATSMERALAGTDPSDVSSTFHRVVECLQELSSVCFLNQE